MKNLFLYIVALLIIFVFTGTAKEFKFCVLGKKGTVQVKTSKSKKLEDVKTGDKLFLNDNLVLEEGSYIGLVYNNVNRGNDLLTEKEHKSQMNPGMSTSATRSAARWPRAKAHCWWSMPRR